MSVPAEMIMERNASHDANPAYAGDITVIEAWRLLEQSADAVLVDVRTPQEWEQVGLPDLSDIGKAPIRLSWMVSPDGNATSRFVEEFSQLGVAQDTPVLLLCRSGGRSAAAACALTAAGFRRCLNVSDGFEGQAGWKAAQLPWTQ
ncbi:MAG: rhodanese-like domain-containing protein [Rickettsiales bacterium]